MTLNDTMRRHMARTITRLDHMGEEVRYRSNDGKSLRTVRCVVERTQTGSIDRFEGVGRLQAVLVIPNDATVGVEAVLPGDEVFLALRHGRDPQWARITEVINSDAAAFTVEVTG